MFDTRRLNARDFRHQSRPTIEGQNFMWNQHYNSSEKQAARVDTNREFFRRL
jgi:hypothetical protein